MTSSIKKAVTLSWKPPLQERSRTKVEAILVATHDLAVELGHLDLKMTEIAKRADVPVGTLYQFFPNRNSILSVLFEKEMEPIDRTFHACINTSPTIESLIQNIEDLLQLHIRLVEKNKGLFVIWSSPAMDPAIQAADIDNTYKNASALTECLHQMLPKPHDKCAVHATSLLVCHLWGSVIRLCILIDSTSEKKAVLQQYSRMLKEHLRSLSFL